MVAGDGAGEGIVELLTELPIELPVVELGVELWGGVSVDLLSIIYERLYNIWLKSLENILQTWLTQYLSMKKDYAFTYFKIENDTAHYSYINCC